MYTVKNYYSKLSYENKILMHFSHSFFHFFGVLLFSNSFESILFRKRTEPNWMIEKFSTKSFEWPEIVPKKIENKTKNNKNLQQLLLCATQSLFACDTQQSGNAQANGSSPTSLQVLKRSCFSFKYKNQANPLKIKQKHAFF